MFVKLFLQMSLLFNQTVKVSIRVAELIADFLKLLQHVDDRLDGFFDDLSDRLCRVELWFLFEQPARVTFGDEGLSDIVVINARHDAQQRTLAGAVQTQHADFRAIVKAQ